MPPFLNRTAILLLTILASMLLRIDPCLADDTTDALIQWVQSKPGGYFNSDKLEIRRMDPADASSPFGVFSKADLAPMETLMQIPRECYIHIFDDAKNMDTESMEKSTKAYHANLCMLSKKLMEEMKLGDKSDYAPYVRYLNNQGKGQIPATWSKEGKALLRDLLPRDNDGVDWIDLHFKKDCISSTDPFEEHVVALTKQRCSDTALIPVWDMINHDNGMVNTNTTSMYNKDGMRVWPTRLIRAGEELYFSYDKCVDCMDLDEYWGTPEILRDFGFVERYPRRFVHTDREIWFEVHEGVKGVKEVRWDDYSIKLGDNPDDFDCSPSRSGIDFMQEELERILQLPPHDGECPPTMNVPLHECAMILQYKIAATEALSLAIDSAESRLSKDEL